MLDHVRHEDEVVLLCPASQKISDIVFNLVQDNVIRCPFPYKSLVFDAEVSAGKIGVAKSYAGRQEPSPADPMSRMAALLFAGRSERTSSAACNTRGSFLTSTHEGWRCSERCRKLIRR